MTVSPVSHYLDYSNTLKTSKNNKNLQTNPKLQEEILKLQEVDTHVKNHEAAHKAAALAPADPSPQDLKVAATASTIENQARTKSKNFDVKV